MRWREFIAWLGSATAWPLVARAQQPALPVAVLVSARSADTSADVVAAFRKGLGETGYVEGQNVTVEYHWLEGQFDRLPALMADLVRRPCGRHRHVRYGYAACGQSRDRDDPDRLRRR
jgi:putative ABC transport system substrate-binding protein